MPRRKNAGTFQTDNAWQNKTKPAAKKIIEGLVRAEGTIEDATPEQDLKRATDFVVRIPGEGTIACRTLVWDGYHTDMTLRAWRENGAPVELAKIQQSYRNSGGEGEPRYYFTCWRSIEDEIVEWTFVNMKVFMENNLESSMTIPLRE